MSESTNELNRLTEPNGAAPVRGFANGTLQGDNAAANNGLLGGYYNPPQDIYQYATQPQLRPVPMVYGQMIQVMRELGEEGIEKKGVMEMGAGQNKKRVAFRGIEQVLLALNPLLVKHGLIVIPSVEDSSVERLSKETNYGTQITMWTKLKVRYTVYCAIDGSSVSSVYVTEASAQDDKGFGKAWSYSLKEWVFKTFMVPTEGVQDDQDGPDVRESQPSSANRPSPNVAMREARQRGEMLEADRQRQHDNTPSTLQANGEASAMRAQGAQAQKRQYEPPRAKLRTNKYDGQLLTDIPANGLSDYFGQLTHINAKPEHQGALNRRMFDAVTEITARIHLLTTAELAKYAERLERLPKSETGMWNKANAAKDLEWDKRVQAEMKGDQKP